MPTVTIVDAEGFPRFRYKVLHREVFLMIPAARSVRALEEIGDRVGELPVYARLSLAFHLVRWLDELPDKLDRSTDGRLRDEVNHPYVWRGRGHDLNRYSGKAAQILDRLLGVSLPTIKPTSTWADRRSAAVSARRCVERWFHDVAGRQAGSDERRLAELSAKYRGRIIPLPGEGAAAPDAEMDHLCDEWNPIGQPLGDFERVLGVSARSVGSDEYRFSGFLHRGGERRTALPYSFTVRTLPDGRICALARSR